MAQREASRVFSVELTSVRDARRWAGTVLRRWGVDDDGLALLVLDELVTNAVLHGWPPVAVTLSREDLGPVHIAVSDRGGGAVAPREVINTEVSGRGLTIVARVARSWGVRTQAGSGKTVWADVRTGLGTVWQPAARGYPEVMERSSDQQPGPPPRRGLEP